MRLIVFGLGYTARALVRALPDGTPVLATSRSSDGFLGWTGAGRARALFPGEEDKIAEELQRATHVLVTIPPVDGADIVAARMQEALVAAAGGLDWLGYLSTTGVYGDHAGGWVDETTPLSPGTARGAARVAAEDSWRDLWRENGLPVHIFRLAGIYGPGRSAFDRLRSGTARCIVKPGQVFSRIHVDDIVQVLLTSMAQPDAGAVYNLADDESAPPQDVIAFAATLLGLPVPPNIDFDSAELSAMARSFYSESKRVRNDRIKTALGIALRHPSYRDGLKAILADESQG